MPVGPGRFRVTTTKTGQKVRLHFTPGPNGKVNEAKNLSTGHTHTPGEFAAERAKRHGLQAGLAHLKAKGAFKKGKTR
jgi:hypothetical protein